MAMDISGFARTNKVIFIWTAFAALLYLFRDMFGLVFITYIMCFIAHGLTRGLSKKARLRRRLLVVVLYVLFLMAILSLFTFTVPRILTEAKHFTEQLPNTVAKIDAWLSHWSQDNPSLAPFVDKIKETMTLESLVSRGWGLGKQSMERIFQYFNWFFLGLMFSFLIMLDLPNLLRRVRILRFTRLSSVYEETADSVIMFAKVVGENFRAQILVSTVNTLLTAIGLQILGVGAVALLCSLVFLCGLIPVLGVFISSVPILLMAINTGGFEMALWCLVMIILIHLIEAYILNPRIVSAVMHLNPVMTLIIIYIAHSIIGMWGMLLGVPIAVYFYRQITVGAKSVSARNRLADQGGAALEVEAKDGNKNNEED